VPAQAGEEVTLRRASGEHKVQGLIRGPGGIEVVPFWAGKPLGWEIV